MRPSTAGWVASRWARLVSAQVLALVVSIAALLLSAGAVVYTRQQALHARESNAIEERRDRAARRPHIRLELVGDNVGASILLVHNEGTIDVTRLELTVLGPDDYLGYTGFRDHPGVPDAAGSRSRVFESLRPGVPQQSPFLLVMQDQGGREDAALKFLGRVQTSDDTWEFRALVDLPNPTSWAFVD